MHVPFTSFHKESSVPGYSRRYLCRYLKFWWRELEKMELVSNGTRSSLDRPLHGSFSKFLVNGKRPRSRKKIGWAWYRKMCGVGKRSINLSLPSPRVFFAIVFMISPHYFLEACSRLQSECFQGTRRSKNDLLDQAFLSCIGALKVL